MIFVALAELAVLAAAIVAFAGLLRSQQRAHARREDAHARRESLILDQLLHAVGKTWTPPPAAEDHEDEPPVPRYIPPDQLPVY